MRALDGNHPELNSELQGSRNIKAGVLTLKAVTEVIEEEDEDDMFMDSPHFEENHRSFAERLRIHAATLHSFADALLYQVQFGDHRFLQTLETEGGRLFHMAEACLERERQMQSTRGETPRTWEGRMNTAMFYRTRPKSDDQ